MMTFPVMVSAVSEQAETERCGAAACDVSSKVREFGSPDPEREDGNSKKDTMSERGELEIKIERASEMLAKARKSRVCVIVEDAVLGSVIADAIRLLKLDQGMSVLHELQRGDYVPVAKLTFVTTYALCAELRARRYRGLIVLFSGAVNYLDDEQVASVDYCLPLPSSDQHLSQFVDWLVQQSVTKKSVPALATSANKNTLPATIGPGPPSVTSRAAEFWGCLQESCGWFVIMWQGLSYLLSLTVGKLVRVASLPAGTNESFCKWRLLNPAGSWRHHTVEMWALSLPRAFLTAYAAATVTFLRYDAVIGMLTVIFLYLARTPVYHFVLKPCGIPLLAYWIFTNCIVTGVYAFLVGESLWLGPPQQLNLSMSEFLSTTFSEDTTGAAYLFNEASAFAYARVYTIFQPYPMNIICTALIFVHQTQIAWLVFRTIISVQLCMFLQWLFLAMTVLNVIYQAHIENTYRVEFRTTHEHILAKAFLDQCLDICQQDIRKPLELLLERQKDLVKVVVHAAYCRSIVVDRALLGLMEPLHVSHLLLAETVSELAYSRSPLLTDSDAPVGRCVTDSIELSRAVSRIVSGFSSAAADHHVRIFAEVDNRLAVVLVDWKMLSMLVTNLVSAALRNIRDSCTAAPRNLDLINYIMIKFTAIECEAKVPFVAPRLMLVNVCDSSDAAEKGVAGGRKGQPRVVEVGRDVNYSDQGEAKYGRSVCERLVHRISPQPIFQTIVGQGALRTVQRFSFPYRLNPQTRRAQEYIEGETSLNFVKVEARPAAYLSAYRRLCRTEVPVPSEKFATDNDADTYLRSVLYLSGFDFRLASEVTASARALQKRQFKCTVKYLLKIPSMATVANVDCVIIDQLLQQADHINISDTVLKLRVCGYNGVIAVLLRGSNRLAESIKDELSRSAASVDLLLLAPLKDRHIQQIIAVLEKRLVRQAICMHAE
jgi:hypothetical protein